MGSDVSVYRLTLGITTHAWLCGMCAQNRKNFGWTADPVKTKGEPQFCDDCHYADTVASANERGAR